MYLDDDPYPSIHYTGTEDYFGGSYGFGNDIIIKSYQTFSGLVYRHVCNLWRQPGIL